MSDDDATWTVVAERVALFVSWEARFTPRSARYVRLRVPGNTLFHLASVEIH